MVLWISATSLYNMSPGSEQGSDISNIRLWVKAVGGRGQAQGIVVSSRITFRVSREVPRAVPSNLSLHGLLYQDESVLAASLGIR